MSETGAQGATAVRAIPAGLSLYLDIVRFLAAASVLLYHTWNLYFPHSTVKWPGHEAVVIFFVLSGYVITHAASAPGMTLSIYVRHRVARIIPVAYAALLLALVLSLTISTGEETGRVGWGTLANMLFIAQSGPLTLGAPLNPPFWSLNYEVWYYVMFGIWTCAPVRRRWPLVLFAAVLAGPKILLLLPVWLFGVVLYRHMPPLQQGPAWCCLIVSLVATALMTWLNLSDILRAWLYATVPGVWRAHYSTQVLYDILLGIVVMLHFTAVASLGAYLNGLTRLQRLIRYLAGSTFTLYVFHGPLLVLLRKFDSLHHSPWLFYLAMAALILAIAELTERRVKFYRAVMDALARWLSGRAGKAGSRLDPLTSISDTARPSDRSGI